ncbi:MAG: acetylxylan esterase [Verrucomicrobiota bacterium]
MDCFRLLAAGFALALCLGGRADEFPEPGALPVQTNLPNPLIGSSGRSVRTTNEWASLRRPELKSLFQHYMYGTLPPQIAPVRATVTTECPDFLGGKATLRLLTLATGPKGAPEIHLMLVLPNQRRSPAPVFLGLNFCGNQAVTADPRIPLATGWLSPLCKGITNNIATESSRNAGAADWPGDEWPIESIIDHGCALATFCSCDIDSDRPDISDGLYKFLAHGDQAKNPGPDRGTIAAWAWGFMRCVDYLVSDPAIDPARIAALGHSRNGKTALLAAAFDDRIALAIVHQAGIGGSAPSRGRTGEPLKDINANFPHWFNAEFKKFIGCPEKLLFDQNCLVALCAPRPVLFSNGEADTWANPRGQFDVLVAANPAYELYGVTGMDAAAPPASGVLAGKRLGYYIRPGGHSMTPGDWKVFLEFADRQWGAPAK